MSEKKKLKAVDFFCGAGGMSHGMQKAGIEILAGIDIEEGCRGTYEANHGKGKFIKADVRELSFDELQQKTGIAKNDDDLLFIGCSPCQYWTKMNTIKTKSRESRNLLEDFQKFVDHFRPGYVVIENVPGIFTKTDESPLPGFLAFLKERGYVARYRKINANHYGVPQRRNRFVLIASRVNKDLKFPEPDKVNKPVVADYLRKPEFTPIEAGHKDNSTLLHSCSGLSALNLRRLKEIKKPGGTRHAWKDDPELQLETYKGRDTSFTDVYGRMWWDKPAPTITTKFHSISNGRFGHPEQHRAISLREGAALQTFDSDYVFVGKGTGAIAKQIGNAVPPALAERIASSIINS